MKQNKLALINKTYKNPETKHTIFLIKKEQTNKKKKKSFALFFKRILIINTCFSREIYSLKIDRTLFFSSMFVLRVNSMEVPNMSGSDINKRSTNTLSKNMDNSFQNNLIELHSKINVKVIHQLLSRKSKADYL